MKGWVELHWNFIGRKGKNQHANMPKILTKAMSDPGEVLISDLKET